MNIEDIILKANDAYYNTGTPLYTDEEYDALKQKLKKIDPNNKVFSLVGAEIHSESKFIHINPMLSLENVFDSNTLKKFLINNGVKDDTELTYEDKLDGLACSLHYKNGKLINACTRGNGIVGEIILDQIMHFSNVPKTIDCKVPLEIRGEIVLPKKEFDKLNKIAVENNHKPYTSARNLAVGSIKSKEFDVAAKRGCIFIAYALIGLEKNHSHAMSYLGGLGFDNTIPQKFKFADIDQHIDDMIRLLENPVKEIGMDGIVVKVDSYALQQEIGLNNTFPKWAVAFKQNVEFGETTVNDVEWQVGSGGAITPVAKLDKILLSEAYFTSCTLHNYANIKKLGLGINDKILMVRSGNVIPMITAVSEKSINHIAIDPPPNCPECGHETVLNENDILSCGDPKNCSGVQLRKLIFACSKEGVTIKGIADEVIKHAFENGYIKTIADLYKDDAATAFASKHPNTADKSTPKFLKLINESRKTTRERAITSLGIPMVSTESSKLIANAIDKFSDLVSLNDSKLIEIGITNVRREKFLAYISDIDNINLINELSDIFEFDKKVELAEKLKGLNFVVTGSFDNSYPRKEIEKTISLNSGKVQSKVSSKTNYLILGANGGSKHDDAIRLNIPVITFDEFIKLLE